MISGISTSGLRAAFARFDRSATAVSQSAELETDGVAPPSGGLADAMVAMLSAQMGVRASLEVVRASNDMLAEAIDLGGYLPRD
jgi:hypothetical protein